MPSPFVVQARQAQQAAFDLHAESWIWRPMTSADDRNAPMIDDSSRQGATVPGIYYEKAAVPLIRDGYDPRTDQRPGVSSAHPRVEFPASCAEAQQTFRTGDLLIRLDNGRSYRIGATQTKKTGVQVCAVHAMASAV